MAASLMESQDIAPVASKVQGKSSVEDVVDSTEYEFEDPARCWVDLVVATRILNEKKRKDAVYVLLSEAKNSHWTHQLLDDELELEQDTVEYGGEFEHCEHAQCKDTGTCLLEEPDSLTEPFGDEE